MTNTYIEPTLLQYLYRKATINNTPLAATFELLPLCNMDCKMCYVKLTKEEVDKRGKIKTVDEWLDFAKKLKDEGVLFILLTGGEPFLYDDFKELYIELIKMGFIISINSNGTLIGEEEIKLLSKYPPMRMNITLYGGSRETYQRLCRNEKGFDKVITAIKALKKEDIVVKINCSVTPYNIDDIAQIIEICKELDCPLQTTTYMFPPIRRSEEFIGYNDRFTPEEAGKQAVQIELMQYPKERFITRVENLLKDIREYEEDDNKIDYGQDVLCRAGRSTFWVTWDGRMTPCGMMNYPVEYPFENGFKKSWDSLVDKVKQIKLSAKCATCNNRKTCMTCAAMAITETGDFSKTPEYICKMNQFILEESKIAYEKINLMEYKNFQK